jgi:hypothetical protein
VDAIYAAFNNACTATMKRKGTAPGFNTRWWTDECKAAAHALQDAQALDVTDLRGPPSERTQTEKLQDLKKLTQHYARDRGSCDDVQISYLEILEERDNDNLRLAQMLAR